MKMLFNLICISNKNVSKIKAAEIRILRDVKGCTRLKEIRQ
jgi:hypothetical protein